MTVGSAGAPYVNVLNVEHVRDGVPLGVRQTGVELTLETRGREHGAHYLSIKDDGFFNWAVNVPGKPPVTISGAQPNASHIRAA